MTTEKPKYAGGRHPIPLRCVETGERFPSTVEALAWLASVGKPHGTKPFANALAAGETYAGLHWRRDRAVVCPDTGESWPSIEDAAEAMRLQGYHRTTATQIEMAISDDTRVGKRHWDWRGKPFDYCAQERRTSKPCADCVARRAMSK